MFLALRDLLFARGRFLLMAVVIVMMALMMVLLTGLSSGLVDRNISGIRALPITHLAFEYDDKPTWSNSMVERAMWEGWADQPGVMKSAPLGNTMFNARTSKGEPVTLALWGMEPGSFIDPGADVSGDIGLLVLSHGVSEAGDRIMTDSMRAIAGEYPTARRTTSTTNWTFRCLRAWPNRGL